MEVVEMRSRHAQLITSAALAWSVRKSWKLPSELGGVEVAIMLMCKNAECARICLIPCPL